MPQPIANNILSKPISGSIERADMSLAIEGEGRDYAGNYSGLEWYSSITPIDGKYVIVSKSVGTGLPTHWVTADATDAELLYTVNRLPDVANSQTFTDTGSALDYLATSDRYIVLRSMPNNSDADGLLFSLDANNVSSYPRKGTTWFDINGGGKDIDLFNGPSFNANGYLDFDGTNDYGRLPGGGLSTTAYTKIAWFNPDGATNNIISGGGDGMHAFWMAGSATTLQAGHNGAWGTVAYSPGTMIGKWWFGAVTFNTTTGWKLYMNGQVVSTSANTTTFSGGNAIRIAAYSDAANLFNGQIATAQVYNRVLSDDDIKQNYFGGPIVTDGLVFNIDASNLVSYESGSSSIYQLTGSLTGTRNNGNDYSIINGGAFKFDGIDDYIQYANLLDVGNTFTVNFWIKPTGRARQTIVSNGYPYQPNKGFFMVCPGNGTNNANFFISLGQDQKYAISANNSITLNQTQMVTARVDGANDLIRLYVNGEEVNYANQDNGDVNIEYDTNTFTTGKRGTSNNDYLESPLFCLQIYDRALSVEEIKQNYNAQKQKYQS